ncbi:MAG: MbcA/ParS/Xre antitoxin family protein [Pseudomonadota bacterium]
MEPKANSTQDPTAILAQTEPARVARVAKTLFLAIAREWDLSIPEQAQLLGFLDTPSFSEQILDEASNMPEALLVRISHLWNIHRAIFTLAPMASRGSWIRHPNESFSGNAPLELMMRDGDAGIVAVHQYLSARAHT